MDKNCTRICRNKHYWICNGNLESRLPVCNNEDDLNCFNEAFDAVHQGILIKPCTKVQYKVVEDLYPHPVDEVEFVFHFTKPPLATVKEEYVIYDFVAMISAVGGTMGLCTGFSFMTVTNWLLNYIVSGFHFMNNQRRNRFKIH